MPEDFYTQEMQACRDQAEWMWDSHYKWEPNPTIPKSKYNGTCVTYNACVLQRLGVLQSGQYVWHRTDGSVYGANDKMNVYYPSGTLHQIKSQLQPGDIVMDGNPADTYTGSHIFIITGQWNGNNPYVWDQRSAQSHLYDYEYQRDRHIIAVVRLNAVNPFTPRLTSSGIRGNPYWYSRNPFYIAGYGLPNCTCYAFARFWEISDINHDYSNYPALSTSNAEYWYGYTQDGYERGQEPRLGAVICFADGPFSGDGHVAIVEQINGDGSIITSNSAYGGSFFYTQTLYPPNYLPAAGYVFQGFIYNPYAGGSPWWSSKKAWIYKRALWHREEDLIK